MAVPVKYRSGGGKVIASYNWVDISDGTGMVGLNGLIMKNSSGEYEKLSTEDLHSYKIETTGTTSNAAYTKIIDLDFDLSEFNTSKVISGTAIFELCLNVVTTGAGSSGDKVNGYVKIIVKKWDGTTETEIANVQSGTVSSVFDDGGNSKIIITDLDIPSTTFSKGDILRITLEGWGNAEDTKDCQITIGHDPLNRDGTYIIPSTDDPTTITTFKSYIPFKIQT